MIALKKMINQSHPQIKRALCLSLGLLPMLLTGCQGLTKNIDSLNQSLSKISGVPVQTAKPQSNRNNTANKKLKAKSKPKPKHIKNSWGVSDKQAYVWLHHKDDSYSPSLEAKHVSWFRFWSQQIHAKTTLAQQAKQYCDVNSWSSYEPAKNCEVYMMALSSTSADESILADEAFVKSAGN